MCYIQVWKISRKDQRINDRTITLSSLFHEFVKTCPNASEIELLLEEGVITPFLWQTNWQNMGWKLHILVRHIFIQSLFAPRLRQRQVSFVPRKYISNLYKVRSISESLLYSRNEMWVPITAAPREKWLGNWKINLVPFGTMWANKEWTWNH